MGARFAKWRAAFSIGENLPSDTCVETNCVAMAMYALLCQEAGIVPIVEPEILLEGSHSIEESYEVTTRVLKELFATLKRYKVQMDGVILKSSMVISGNKNENRANAATVGEMTIKCLKESVPSEVPGVVFLSGGQIADEATENLYEINKAASLSEGGVPWQLTFSYARALQGPSLASWNGHDENIPAARERFLERMKANSAARMGEVA
jgi:fructose-bisphosphate aldolase class I